MHYRFQSTDTIYTIKTGEAFDLCGLILQHGLAQGREDENLIYFGNREIWHRLFAFPIAAKSGILPPVTRSIERYFSNFNNPRIDETGYAKRAYSETISFRDDDTWMMLGQSSNLKSELDSIMTTFTQDAYQVIKDRDDLEQIMMAYFKLILSGEEYLKINKLDVDSGLLFISLCEENMVLEYCVERPYIFRIHEQ
ncbi:hypothetical protein [Phaeocystidibacter luteus]|uniref:Uncharacterized protein n=1 Tax=Phaeocystidibacter luteus TaxID=911197 RepID=A0A6N6RDX8_9FLAO|nr:hypothetical protein [Phaeocystidibacter luteus]KAB2807691.1 hypothetical protein F8C67_11665 [Phaeocystidibacter luteus]